MLNRWGKTRPTLVLVRGLGMSLIMLFLFAVTLQPYDYNIHPEEHFVSAGWLILYFFSALVIYVHELIALFKDLLLRQRRSSPCTRRPTCLVHRMRNIQMRRLMDCRLRLIDWQHRI